MRKSEVVLLMAESLVNAQTVATKLSLLTGSTYYFSTKQGALFCDWLAEMLTDEAEEDE